MVASVHWAWHTDPPECGGCLQRRFKPRRDSRFAFRLRQLRRMRWPTITFREKQSNKFVGTASGELYKVCRTSTVTGASSQQRFSMVSRSANREIDTGWKV